MDTWEKPRAKWITPQVALALNTILIGKGDGKWRPLRGEYMIFRKDEGPGRQMGSTIVCDEICLGVVSTFTLFSCDESVLPGWWNSWGGDWWHLCAFGIFCLWADRENSEKPLPEFALLQVPQNNQHTEVASLGVAFPATLPTTHNANTFPAEQLDFTYFLNQLQLLILLQFDTDNIFMFFSKKGEKESLSSRATYCNSYRCEDNVGICFSTNRRWEEWAER